MRKYIWLGSILLVLIVAVGAAWRLLPQRVTDTVRSVVKPAPSVHFAVIGDTHGVNPIYQQFVQDISGQSFDFVLHVADASEYGRTDEFEAVLSLEKQLPFPVYHTVGSHDIKTDPTRATFLQAFGHARWYSVDIRQLHLIVLDNGDRKVGFPSDELDWLAKDLQAHQSTTTIIAYHRPFGLPLADILGDDETKASRATNERFMQIIKNQPVSYIFTAHLHTYLPYTIHNVPAVVTGGGGDPAQLVLGGAKNNYFHYLDVVVRGDVVSVKPVPITLRNVTAE